MAVASTAPVGRLAIRRVAPIVRASPATRLVVRIVRASPAIRRVRIVRASPAIRPVVPVTFAIRRVAPTSRYRVLVGPIGRRPIARIARIARIGPRPIGRIARLAGRIARIIPIGRIPRARTRG